VGVVNVPVTSPPDSVNGFLVAGMPFPQDAALAAPRALGERLESQGYRREAFEGPPQPGREEAWLDRIETIADRRRTLGLALLFERSPEFSFIVFTVADRVQHHLWKFHDPSHPHYRADAPARLKNAVRDAYVWCDGVLGDVRAKLPDDALLFVVSDHGFGPAYSGIVKERALAQWRIDRAVVAGSQNLFGGDFFLEAASADDRRSLTQFLDTLATDEGGGLVREAVGVRDRLANGFGAELGPDVVAFEAEGYLFVPGDASDPLVTPLPYTSFSGYHRRDGFFAACGAPIASGARVAIDLRDVPAWTMHALGEAVPERYTSEIPETPFRPEYFAARPIRRRGGATDGLRRPGDAAPIDESVAAQLEALGYVR
jgi:hypothetical protein